MARPAGHRRPSPPPPPPIQYTPTKLDRAIAAWKRPPLPMSPALAAGAAIAAVIGAVTVGPSLRSGRFGVGLLIAAAAVAYVAGASAWSAGRLVRARSSRGGWRFNLTGGVFLLLAVLLSATPAIRDADWIVVSALALAVATGSYAVCGGRSWAEVIGGGLAVVPASGYMIPWAARGTYRAASRGRGSAWPAIRTGLIVTVLLVVFGGLFIGADAAFGDLAAGLAPEVSAGSVVLYVFAGAATLVLACAGAFLAQAPPPLRLLNPDPAEPAGRWSWVVPIAALDLLFLLFCAIQARMFLADDKDELLRSTGLTYAEYAREGFFQLVIVTVLVLVVVAAAMRYAPSAARADRVAVRALLGLLCALTIVVVAVALRRLYLYEETFGWTRLRLWVHAFELWLGFVVVLVAVAGVVKGRVAWLPRMVAASGAIAMIALVSVNPDGFIAEHNVERYEETGKLDTYYLRDLSADAVPALDRLPEPQRSCALHGIAADLREDEPALGANHARSRAREILNRRPPDDSVSCFAMDGSS
ncbi:DUF4173 domain-containing protein [Actinomadura sp. KC345]|nr:DUF4173 domain-containing protein [Actinomadura sp. KC345]